MLIKFSVDQHRDNRSSVSMLSKRSVVKGPGFVCGSWLLLPTVRDKRNNPISAGPLSPVEWRTRDGSSKTERGGHTHGTPRLQPSMEKLGIEDGARFYMELDSPRTTVTPRAVRAALSFFPSCFENTAALSCSCRLVRKDGGGNLGRTRLFGLAGRRMRISHSA